MFDEALEYANLALQKDSSAENFENRADIYYHMNDSAKCFADMDKACELYYISVVVAQKAWYELNFGAYNEAYDDLFDFILFETPNNSYDKVALVARIEKARGHIDAMEQFCQRIIDNYDKHEDDISLMYAYALLGDSTKAIEILESKVMNNSTNPHYEAACCYSLLGNTDKALEELRTAYEEGNWNFAHSRHDYDLINLRTRPEFEQLVQEYEQKVANIRSDIHHIKNDGVEKICEIPFVREGKLCKVKCTVNGLPLHFIFDTGASDVAISNVEANFMMKNDYLSSSDVVGRQHYMTASGDIIEGTIINIKEVKFGDMTLNDINASVTHNQNAPLLLGQSVLSRLGTIEIDNEKHVIRIKYTEKN